MGVPYSEQVLNASNAAKRLGVYLPATPQDFQAGGITRAQLEDLEKNPPAWLEGLRRQGPHPRPVVAGRLGVSISGLARGGITEPLTTEQINQLRQDPPAWLIHEREVAARVRQEEARAAETRATETKPGPRKPHQAPGR